MPIPSVSDRRFLSLSDLTLLPPPVWLIDGLFERQSLVMLAGAPASFKSFLLLDWLLCMASGRKWQGRPTATAKVAYILGEGRSGLLRRVQAWKAHNDLTFEENLNLDLNFRVCFDVPQVALKSSTDNFLADLTKEGFTPEVVAIDTFARSFVGLDENDAKDAGAWVDSADRLRQLGYAVLVLQHTVKNTAPEFGGARYRGSSAIMGAMDTAFTMTRSDNTCTVKVSKQKDHDEGPDLKFRKLDVQLGGGEKSCVLVPMMMIDTDFEEDHVEVDYTLDMETVALDLLADPSFKSDRARARTLATKLGKTETAAQSLIARVKREKGPGID